jgi:hypothetical protein
MGKTMDNCIFSAPLVDRIDYEKVTPHGRISAQQVPIQHFSKRSPLNQKPYGLEGYLKNLMT